MAVKHEETVQRYVIRNAQMISMLESMQEFVSNMPAPDENGHIPCINYGHIGTMARIHDLLKEASDAASQMGN
jgi:hypothetical protein